MSLTKISKRIRGYPVEKADLPSIGSLESCHTASPNTYVIKAHGGLPACHVGHLALQPHVCCVCVVT